MKSDNSLHLIELVNHYDWRFGAELGVRRGDFTLSLLSNCHKLNMKCVDLWAHDQSMDENHNHNNNYTIFINSVKEYLDRITIYKMLTNQASKNIIDNSLDFVFIDATHTYNAVKEDCNLWLPKIKNNGLLCGHDYCEAFDKGGVVRAIKEINDDIVELPRGNAVNCNVTQSVELIKAGKNVADLHTGCWFIWKYNI